MPVAVALIYTALALLLFLDKYTSAANILRRNSAMAATVTKNETALRLDYSCDYKPDYCRTVH